MLNRASEVMFFVSPESGKRPVKVELALANGMSGHRNIMLEETGPGGTFASEGTKWKC